MASISIADSTSSAAEFVTFLIQFSEPVVNFNSSAISIEGAGKGNGRLSISVKDKGNATMFHVTVDGLIGEGAVSLMLKDNTVYDEAGNPCAGATSSFFRGIVFIFLF